METRRIPLLAQSLGTERAIVSFHYGPQDSGRKAYLQSSLHADELPGMLVNHVLKQRLAQLEAEGKLRAEIVLVPVANPIGLNQHVQGSHTGRFEQLTGENFNRSYPDLAALIVEGLAEVLTQDPLHNQRVIRERVKQALATLQPGTELEAMRLALLSLSVDADLVLDLHCDWEAVFHLYTADPLWETLKPLAQLLGAHASLLATVSGDSFCFDEANSQIWWQLRGRFPDYPIPNGSVAATLELRGQSEVSWANAEHDADALLGYLAHQGYVDLPPPALPPLLHDATPLSGTESLQAPHSGVVVYRAEPGAWLRPGDPVVDVVDPLSDRVTTLHASIEGVLYARHFLRFATCGASLARIAGSTPIRSGNLLSQ
ncbi:succinylglutamate desuccinylase/aspartoacylase family protein [Leeia aquatica]|uniref:Succinylglutamate desuccinylase/aspartoacylase family protein n=1 Tax=Leeia aquatica TaxID=2725557 RepID=A0A847SB30_9NEIS|nr:succinylglutamate desuccinylase/aspartoacylase family protein [Leeia aquatica]NLR74539.1 succinylglutamate desuccinylase/aspartoacylase family protein [Leeia aquatica]